MGKNDGALFRKGKLLCAASQEIEYYTVKNRYIVILLHSCIIYCLNNIIIYLIFKKNCRFLPLSGVFFNDMMSVAIAFRTNDISDMRYLHKKGILIFLDSK